MILRRFKRAATFAWHMPVEKLLWRFALTARRQIDKCRRPGLSGADIQLALEPPRPVFAPRAIPFERVATGWKFEFLGRTLVTREAIDWLLPGTMPEDQLWRMNLHYMEYLEGVGAATGIDLIRQWISKNPPYGPGYWHDAWNSYTLSLRVVCWMQFLVRHQQLAAVPDIVGSIASQMRFLVANLERDLGGNHLVKNIKALLWAGACFEGKEPDRWRRTGADMLATQITAQILPDGMHYERSPSYHAQVAADLIECRVAMGDTAPASLDDTIERMAQTAIDLSLAGDRPGLFNDAGLTMAYPPEEIARVAALITRRAPTRRRAVFAYPDAGYFGAHSERLSVICDMGRIGPDDLPAHAHGDIGSFELAVDGLAVIVDQGVFEYVAGPKRAASRASASHNVLSIDGADQAEFFGAFRCGTRPKVDHVQWHPDATGFALSGRHDGYRRTAGGPYVTRRLSCDGDCVAISDHLSGPPDGAVRVALLLHPEVEIDKSDGATVLRRGASRIMVDTTLDIQISDAVWWPDMGLERRTRRLYLVVPANTVDAAFALRIQS